MSSGGPNRNQEGEIEVSAYEAKVYRSVFLGALTLFAEAGVRNSSQIMVLITLADAEVKSMTSLAEAAGISTAAVTGLVDFLEKRPQPPVERFHGIEDRRVIFVRLTPAGHELLSHIGFLPTLTTP